MRTHKSTGLDAGTAAGSAKPAALELRDVHMVYRGAVPVHSLRGVNLTLARGESAAVVGPSGSGKSTLLHLAAGLDRPTGGQVRIAGASLAGLSDAALSGLRARHVGVVFQQFFLMERLTAVENVAAGLLYRGTRSSIRITAAHQALKTVGLAHRASHRAAELSGGERQRVAIARALVGRPTLILADEPTGNLDSANGARVMELLHRLHEAGAALLVITHDRDIAAAMPRRVEVRDGLIISDSRAAIARNTGEAANTQNTQDTVNAENTGRHQ
ncbi:ABC transporter ATP-binding protein [Catenulispora rubra]|uniref:ABC transporter ATP-binding protein n=1 Tax=Catenulispora rubra TaxID=280293 RepID=UPI0018920E0E|nr:ABC transporter ATP-binding protein [Catenulispora rubra]